MDSLHAEQCEPQMKIDIFVNAIRNTFFQQNEKSTKQTQTTEQPMMTLDPSSSTKHRTSNSDTDSAYNTEAESNYTECLPRPSKSQQITNTKCNQGTKPSRIPVPNHTKSNSKTSHLSTSTHQTKPKTPTASTYHQRIRKTPLLPTPPSPVRNFNYSSHYKQYTTRPSAFNNRNPAFTRPSPFYNRLHQQPIITRPSLTYNNFHHQPLLLLPAFTRPYPQTQGHFFTRPYQQQQPHGHFPQPVYNIYISLPYPPQYCTA